MMTFALGRTLTGLIDCLIHMNELIGQFLNDGIMLSYLKGNLWAKFCEFVQSAKYSHHDFGSRIQ
jgi:hypothetical protein